MDAFHVTRRGCARWEGAFHVNWDSGGSRISRGGDMSKILYVGMKELGPLGGVTGARPLDPPMWEAWPCADTRVKVTSLLFDLGKHGFVEVKD